MFSLVMIYFALLHYKRGEINVKEISSWIVIWASVIFITLFPDIARAFSESFLFARLFDLVVLSGVALTIFLSAKAYLISRRNQNKLEDFIRKEAINKSKNNK
jgi:hypothetical protein